MSGNVDILNREIETIWLKKKEQNGKVLIEKYNTCNFKIPCAGSIEEWKCQKKKSVDLKINQ